jgi:ferredoxin
MIFYFSGTGNSLQAAKAAAEHNGEKLISIAADMNSHKSSFEYTLKDNEIIGFVFPIYAWAPPAAVMNFIRKLKLNNYNNNYTFSIVTCGENIGNTMKLLQSELKKRNLNLHSGFSLRMPNNYNILGYDVDAKELEKEKLTAAEETLKHINKIIEERQKGAFEVVKGAMPFVLTSVINPLFNKGGMDTKKFYSDDNCTGCSICEKVCNAQTIKVDKKPVWGKECTQCLACINLCPVKAIQYGKGTVKKGRYKNPNVKISEMMITAEKNIF